MILLFLWIITVSSYLVVDYDKKYQFNMTVGGQKLLMTIDASYADTFIHHNHDYCDYYLDFSDDEDNEDYEECLLIKLYNPEQSETFTPNNNLPAWRDGSDIIEVNSWGSDIFNVNGKKLNVTFALANTTFFEANSLGLGFPKSEVTNLTPEYNINTTGVLYDNFLQSLKNEGIISRLGYSIVFNEDKETGRVILGGVDNKRYKNLVTLPLNDTTETTAQILVDYLSLGFNDTSVDLIDNTTILQITNNYDGIFLPEAAYDKFRDTLRASYSAEKSFLEESNVSLNFEFGDLNIEIPWEDFTSPRYESAYDASTDTSNITNTSQVLVSVYGSSDNTIYIADSLLKNAYFYLDMEGKTVSLGNLVATNSSDVQSVDAVPITQPSDSSPTESQEDGNDSAGSKIYVHWVMILVMLFLFTDFI